MLPEVPILALLLALLAAAGPDEDAIVRAAAQALEGGDPAQALALTQNFVADPRIAALHLVASRQVQHPLTTGATCDQVIRMVQHHWPDALELMRTCGWHLVATRTRKEAATRAARHLLDADPYDTNARGLLVAAQGLDELPVRRWTPPAPPRPDGLVRARRKRDFAYLWAYLRPEDGDLTVEATTTFLPEREVAQARVGAHADLYLRGHEIVPAGWRATARVGDDGGLPRAWSHQLHGGYRLTLFPRWPMQLDGALIVGKGRDEAAIRARGEWVTIGVVSADLAGAWTPWGRHAALQLGWNVVFEGLVHADLRVEGQVGTGGPRGLVKLGLARWIGRVTVRADGQLGRAARPIGDRFLVEDLPGLEGAAASLTLRGPLTERVSVEGRLGLRHLHADFDAPGDLAGQVGLAVTGRW